MNPLIMKIQKLKVEKNAVILAHYYVCDEVQDIADYIGDSYYLSKVATEIPQDNIILCGVTFMGESAKLLNPHKNIFIPDTTAHCPMAKMANINKIKNIKEQYEDVAIVCYINSTAEIKAHSDVCVTSSNALKIIKQLPNKNIYFIPDENLGRFISLQIPEKNFIFNNGYCHVHKNILRTEVLKLKKIYPNSKILVHPECTPDVVELGDYIGSTSEIINFATESQWNEFIICTENGVLHQLKLKNPNKLFYTVNESQYCPDMKKITLDKVYEVLKNSVNTITLTDEVKSKANLPLIKMLELGN